jgi:hyperosmotically inducible periplasmic protein
MKMRSTCMPLSASKAAFLIVFLSAALGIGGCEKEGAAEEAGKKIDQAAEKAGTQMDETKTSLGEKAGRTEQYMQDSAITAKIKGEILRDPALKVFQVHVNTSDGVVTLSGSVDSQANIDRVADMARASQHVTTVVNNLTLK